MCLKSKTNFRVMGFMYSDNTTYNYIEQYVKFEPVAYSKVLLMEER